MLIEHIELNNFRVYYGQQRLQFATDPVTNISVIAGNNGFGKTSFLTALVWCLYGKLMVDVDNKYRQEILEAGGYSRYCEKLMNRAALEESNVAADFSVKIKLTGLIIPAAGAESIEVKRTFYTASKKETIEILLNGRANELTKEVSPEIFINDFILPKEIAKFFFFDAEKIVSLAEIKHVDEKKFLSHAYSEVLGIKKYVDLRSQLEHLRFRLRQKSAQKADRDRLEKLQKQAVQNDKVLSLYKQQEEELIQSLEAKRIAADRYQEQLIREGSTLTLDELKALRERQYETSSALQKIKQRFTELLELAPFAIAAGKMSQVREQLEHESNNSPAASSLLKKKFTLIEHILRAEQHKEVLSIEVFERLRDMIQRELITESSEQTITLLDFSPEQQNHFLAVHENLKNAYARSFRQVVADLKKTTAIGNGIQRRLAEAESKEKNQLIIEARSAKKKIEQSMAGLEENLTNLRSKSYATWQDNQNISRQISELAKKVKVEDIDKEKDAEAERIIKTLDTFILQLKSKKKDSLEKNLLHELKQLMHKDFVFQVKVVIDGDLIDIELHDHQFRKVDKESLSKGEQQLYATALLKALIDESNIRFPVFIDSPLQKFDRQHSRNIIEQFYPNIGGQVILFPLLQKELSELEYSLLEPKVGRSYLITQEDRYKSSFREVEASRLFETHNSMIADVR
jgi:DNA sulfur modification protein DndD